MAKATDEAKPTKAIVHQKQTKQPSWSTMKTLFAFRNHPNASQQTRQPQKQNQKLEDKREEDQKQKQRQRQGERTGHEMPKQKQKQNEKVVEETGKKCKKMRCSGSLCSNTKVIHRPESSLSPETTKKTRGNNNSVTVSSGSAGSRSKSTKTPLRELNVNNGGVPLSSVSVLSVSNATNAVAVGGSLKGMPFRRFYGCYECRMVVDPRNPSHRTTICSCPDCREIFMNAENLELHQSVRHAVSEVGAEDTSKNIVEIIFQSSWLKKQTPICKIERILKVHNTQTRISRFEQYRDFIKSKATNLPKKNPRCVADGNELLRFHCTTASCPLGLNGSTNLCNSIPTCHVCSIIKNGFKIHQEKGKSGILTTATSGRAHDSADAWEGKRAMLVCRVIAGRVRKAGDGNSDNNMSSSNDSEYDSVAGEGGVYSNMDELYVFNPKAILPCFVVIYSL